MSVDRLCTFFGFTKLPFGRDLAPASLFRSAAHSEAVARLTWCVEERGLGTLTGEVGCGKTVAARATVAGLDPSRQQVIYCANPTVGGRGILSMVVAALGGVPRFHRSALVPQAADALALAEAERGRRVLLVIDEGHLLDPDQLEDLRMITNTEMDSRSPAAGILLMSLTNSLVRATCCVAYVDHTDGFLGRRWACWPRRVDAGAVGGEVEPSCSDLLTSAISSRFMARAAPSVSFDSWSAPSSSRT